MADRYTGGKFSPPDSNKCYEVMAIRDAYLLYDTKQVGSEQGSALMRLIPRLEINRLISKLLQGGQPGRRTSNSFHRLSARPCVRPLSLPISRTDCF